jgi:hypothetical protein
VGTRTTIGRALMGVGLADALLLGYGLVRPDSHAFSIPFLIAPSLILLWSQMRGADHVERHLAIWLTIGVAIATVIAVSVALLGS